MVNPIRQFTRPQGLPYNSLTEDSRVPDTFGKIAGFIALDVTPISQFPSFKDTGYLPSDLCSAIQSGIQASVIDPSSGQ
ncbi:hypothetical protein FRC05_003324, partial [Tulasnella sp. 425]